MENLVVETPILGKKIELRKWITGAESEYINAPLMNNVRTKDGSPEVTIQENTVSEINHRLLEKFVVSIDGIKEDIVKNVLNLPEQDTEFIYNTIAELRKKK